MSITSKIAGKIVNKVIKKNILVGYQIFSKADELSQDYRIQSDKLNGQIVKELDALLQIDSNFSEGKDYFYFSIHGLKGASFAWNKTGNAIAFKVQSSDENGNGSAYVGRTYYFVTACPIVIQPSSGIEILAHARSGSNNDKFFTSVFNDMDETSTRLKTMTNPSQGTRAIP